MEGNTVQTWKPWLVQGKMVKDNGKSRNSTGYTPPQMPFLSHLIVDAYYMLKAYYILYPVGLEHIG